MLVLEGVKSAYGRIEALHGVTLQVNAGEIVALVGSNGAGKTTLLRVISGVQSQSAGRLAFNGRGIERSSPDERVALGIVQVPEGRQIFAPLTVEDNLRLGAYLRRDDQIAADMARVFELFPVLAEKRSDVGGGLSGGQQQMLAVGRALMSKPRLLLLDEPSMGLAPVLVEQIFSVIVRLAKEGTTIFLVEQNAFAALSIANRGYVLETGNIVLEGTGAELLADARVREAYLGL